jgi:1-acyl-sn-glycerol-3-phosphate acyltransferase
MTGIRVKVTGLENFQKGHNYVVICNHNSFMDIPVSSTKLPGPNKTIAKIEMSRLPIFGTLYKLGSVLVDRKNKDSRRQSILQMKQVLQMGIHMIIYPEGTRNKSPEPMGPFHNGAFNLAVETQKKSCPPISSSGCCPALLR